MSADNRVLLAVFAGAALAVTYVLAVQTRAGQLLDTHVMTLAARQLMDANWPPVLLAAISPLSVLLATALLGLIAWTCRGAAAAAAATATTAGTIVAAVALKLALNRPALVDDSLNSFPSGHVAAIAALAAAATIASRPAWRPLVALMGLILTSMTGVATLALQWHRPSDVLASALLAMTVAAVADTLAAQDRERAA